jgi:hypothetical protein
LLGTPPEYPSGSSLAHLHSQLTPLLYNVFFDRRLQLT